MQRQLCNHANWHDQLSSMGVSGPWSPCRTWHSRLSRASWRLENDAEHTADWHRAPIIWTEQPNPVAVLRWLAGWRPRLPHSTTQMSQALGGILGTRVTASTRLACSPLRPLWGELCVLQVEPIYGNLALSLFPCNRRYDRGCRTFLSQNIWSFNLTGKSVTFWSLHGDYLWDYLHFLFRFKDEIRPWLLPIQSDGCQQARYLPWLCYPPHSLEFPQPSHTFSKGPNSFK